MKITRSYYDSDKSYINESAVMRSNISSHSNVGKNGNIKGTNIPAAILSGNKRSKAIYESMKIKGSNKYGLMRKPKEVNESTSLCAAKERYSKLYEAVKAGPISPEIVTTWLDWESRDGIRGYQTVTKKAQVQADLNTMCEDAGIGYLRVAAFKAAGFSGSVDIPRVKLAGDVRNLAYWFGIYVNEEYTSIEEMEDRSDDELMYYIDEFIDEAGIDAVEQAENDYISAAEDEYLRGAEGDDDAFNAAMNDIMFDEIEDIDNIDDIADDDNEISESVASRFGKYRRMFEEAEALNEKGDEEDDFSDIFGEDDEQTEDSNADGEEQEVEGDGDSDEESSEDVPMTAVVLTVGKDDADKCKEELIDAGVAEDDVEILDSEDDEETVKIKVDVNSVHELKDYLSGKGIDLEEKIGGEIIDDEEGGESDDKEEKKDGEGEDDFDDMDLGDIFGDDEEDSDEGGEVKESILK